MKKICYILIVLFVFGCSNKGVSSKVIENKEKDMSIYKPIIEKWNSNYEINNDYIGDIKFDSGLIDLEVVQGRSNEQYIRTDWKSMTYDSEGSIFMDYRNSLDDQNIIIYGHYIYLSKEESGTHKFTPLRFLTKQKNYKENKNFSLILKNEKRNYEIAYVYYCEILGEKGNQYTTDETMYYITNYDSDYFEKYKTNIYIKNHFMIQV